MLKHFSLAILTTATIFVANSAIAGYVEGTKKSTCYIFKNNKLVKKSPCTYHFAGSGNIAGSYTEFDIKVPKYGNYTASFSNSSENSPVSPYDDLENTVYEESAELNDSVAKHFYRSAKTLAIRTKYTENQLECFKNAASGFEICFK